MNILANKVQCIYDDQNYDIESVIIDRDFDASLYIAMGLGGMLLNEMITESKCIISNHQYLNGTENPMILFLEMVTD